MTRLLDWLTHACSMAAALVTLGMMLLIGIDVIGRNLAGLPLNSVPELVSLAIVAIVFLQLPLAVREKALPQTILLLDYLQERQPNTHNTTVRILNMIAALVFGIIAFYSLPLLTKAFAKNTFAGAIGTLTIPIWPIKAVIVFGCTLAALQFLASVRDPEIPQTTSVKADPQLSPFDVK